MVSSDFLRKKVCSPAKAGLHSAGASGTEGGAIGFTLGAGLLIMHADSGGAALAVNGVILAVGHVAAYAGIGTGSVLLVHFFASSLGVRCYYLILFQFYSEGKSFYGLIRNR